MPAEYSYNFYQSFLKNNTTNRDYAMIILPDKIEYISAINLELHHSIILIDLNCENSLHLLTKVFNLHYIV